MISAADALRLVLESAPAPMPAEPVGLLDAVGRTLAVGLVATANVPPADNSALDGFAVRAADLTAPLTISGTVRAGDEPGRLTVAPGAAVRISTGAPLPDGADAVVPVEQTQTNGLFLTILKPFAAGHGVRRCGTDLAIGQSALAAGTVLTPWTVATAAALGRMIVAVHRRPVVAVVTSGDELVPADTPDPLPPGKIRDANGPMLAALIWASGGEPRLIPTAPDRELPLAQALISARETADLIVTVGGVSMGEHDLTRRVLTGLGYNEQFWQVAQRPGKPLAFGTWDAVPVVGLPGNPASAAVCFDRYVRPLLWAMTGREPHRPAFHATLTAPLAHLPGLTHFVRVHLTTDEQGRWLAHPTGDQTSHRTRSLAAANGLLILPPTAADPTSGAAVTAELLS